MASLVKCTFCFTVWILLTSHQVSGGTYWGTENVTSRYTMEFTDRTTEQTQQQTSSPGMTVMGSNITMEFTNKTKEQIQLPSSSPGMTEMRSSFTMEFTDKIMEQTQQSTSSPGMTVMGSNMTMEFTNKTKEQIRHPSFPPGMTDMRSNFMNSTQPPDENTTSALDLTTMAEVLSPIVTDSVEEQVITMSVIIFVWIYGSAINSFLLYVIKQTPELYDNCQYTLQACYMLCDIVNNCVVAFNTVPILAANTMNVMSHGVCRAWGTAGIASYHASVHVLGYLGLERYVYFCHPMKYNRFFSRIKIIITFICISLLGLLYSLLLELLIGRQPVTTVMMCQTPQRVRSIVNPVAILFYFVPSAVISIFTLIKMRWLISKHQARVTPAVTEGVVSQAYENMTNKVRKAIKMVGLVSGTFWATMVPGMIIRSVIYNSGTTWNDTDTRRHMQAFVMARLSWFTLTLMSTILNPIIYLTVQVELRKAAMKCLIRLNPCHK